MSDIGSVEFGGGDPQVIEREPTQALPIVADFHEFRRHAHSDVLIEYYHYGYNPDFPNPDIIPLSQRIQVADSMITRLGPADFRDFLEYLTLADDGSIGREHLSDILDYFELLMIDPVAQGDRAGNTAYDRPNARELRYSSFLREIGDDIRGILAQCDEPGMELDPRHIERLYSFLQSPERYHQLFGVEYIPQLIALDERNGDRAVGIRGRAVRDLENLLMRPEPPDLPTRRIVAETFRYDGDIQDEIFIEAMARASDGETVGALYERYAHMYSTEQVQMRIRRHARLAGWPRERVVALEHAIGLPNQPFDEALEEWHYHQASRQAERDTPFHRPEARVRVGDIFQFTQIAEAISNRSNQDDEIYLSDVIQLDESIFDTMTPEVCLELLDTMSRSVDNGSLLVRHFNRLASYIEDYLQSLPETDDWRRRDYAYNFQQALEQVLVIYGDLRGQDLPPAIRTRLLNWMNHPHWQLRQQGFHFIPYLARLDSVEPERSINTRAHAAAELERRLRNILHESTDEIEWLMDDMDKLRDYVEYHDIDTVDSLVCQILEETHQSEALTRIVVSYANAVGLEESRERIRQYAINHRWPHDTLARVASVVDREADHYYESLWELYKKAHFGEDHEPNRELQNADLTVLRETFKNARRLLDVGCGDGRLVGPLLEDGHVMTGIDMMEEHLDRARVRFPDARFLQRSWHRTEFPMEERFDGIYCLGRSFLHNLTDDAAINMLREMNRLQEVGNCLIIDSPDPEFGDYAYEIERMQRQARELGIRRKRPGFIIDGPKPGLTFDRRVPMPDEIQRWAEKAGYRAEIVREHMYGAGPHGQNKNVYWKLTKMNDTHLPQWSWYDESRHAEVPLDPTD